MAQIKITEIWQDSELLTIGKYKYYYITDEKETLIVYLFDGQKITYSELMKRGINFVMPSRIRKDEK